MQVETSSIARVWFCSEVLGSAATRCGSYSTISELMVWFGGVGLFVEPVALQRRKSLL